MSFRHSYLLFIVACCATLLFTPLASVRADATGHWKLDLERDGNSREYYADLVEKDGKLSGNFISPRSGKYEIQSGEVDGEKFRFSVDREFNGTPVTIEIAGKLDGKGKGEATVTAQGQEFAKVGMTQLPSLVGLWKAQSESPDGDQTYDSTITIERGDKGLTGHIESELGKAKVDKIDRLGEKVEIEFELDFEGNVLPVALELTLQGEDKLDGKWIVETDNEDYEGKWSAKRARQFDLSGTWDVVAETSDDSHESVSEFAKAKDGYKGKYTGGLGESLAYDEITVQGKEVRLELTADFDGNSVTFVVEANIEDDNLLEGRWTVQDNDDYSGGWTAKRRVPKKADKPKSAKALGHWDAKATLPEGDVIEFTLQVRESSGTLKSEQGEKEITDVQVQGSTVSFHFVYEDPNDGNEYPVDFEGQVKEDGSLEGEWELEDGTSGKWSAVRQTI